MGRRGVDQRRESEERKEGEPDDVENKDEATKLDEDGGGETDNLLKTYSDT